MPGTQPSRAVAATHPSSLETLMVRDSLNSSRASTTATWLKADEVGFILASDERGSRAIFLSSKEQEKKLCEG
jgi:hypothetical protein